MTSSKLALFGGKPVINSTYSQAVWPCFTEDAKRQIKLFLNQGIASYQRRDGIVALFEDAFSEFTGMSYAITTHSGTGALHAGYFALNLPIGGEVIVPAYTHLGTALPMLHMGLVPVLCDIDESDGTLDVADVESAITSDTVAIAVMHPFGQPADTKALRQVASKHGLGIVQDCSHAHGATNGGHHVGSDGDVACFSLQSHKAIPAGEGGVLLTNDPELAERAALLGHFREPRQFTSEALRRFVNTGWGLKSRLHPFAAVLAMDGLKTLPTLCEARARNYSRLEAHLQTVPGVDVFPTRPDTTRGGFFRFPLHIRQDELNGLSSELFFEALQAEGAVAALPGSLARPLHTYSIFQEDIMPYFPVLAELSRRGRQMPRYRSGDFPRAERLSDLTIQLPAFGPGQELLVDLYAEAIQKVCFHAGDLLTHAR